MNKRWPLRHLLVILLTLAASVLVSNFVAYMNYRAQSAMFPGGGPPSRMLPTIVTLHIAFALWPSWLAFKKLENLVGWAWWLALLLIFASPLAYVYALWGAPWGHQNYSSVNPLERFQRHTIPYFFCFTVATCLYSLSTKRRQG